MDHRSDLTPSPSPAQTPVVVDHAIFTSVRSINNEGYRIIAASAGIRADDKIRITRQSPSHGGLSDTSADAVGLSTYRLDNDRVCVAHSCYAGTEHTGRGGQRVHTHVVVLDGPAYVQFACHPICVRAALLKATGGPPVLPSSDRLDPLLLTPKSSPGRAPVEHAVIVSSIASAVLTGKRLILFNAHEPMAILEWVLWALPKSARQMLSISVGLTFSPSRPAQLTFISGHRDQRQTQRTVMGSDIECLDLDSTFDISPVTAIQWFALVERYLTDGRSDEIVQLTADPDHPAEPDELDRLAVATCTTTN